MFCLNGKIQMHNDIIIADSEAELPWLHSCSSNWGGKWTLEEVAPLPHTVLTVRLLWHSCSRSSDLSTSETECRGGRNVLEYEGRETYHVSVSLQQNLNLSHEMYGECSDNSLKRRFSQGQYTLTQRSQR